MSKASFVYVTYIRSTPPKVWQALTDSELTKQYWGHRNVSDWSVGSAWACALIAGPFCVAALVCTYRMRVWLGPTIQAPAVVRS